MKFSKTLSLFFVALFFSNSAFCNYHIFIVEGKPDNMKKKLFKASCRLIQVPLTKLIRAKNKQLMKNVEKISISSFTTFSNSNLEQKGKKLANAITTKHKNGKKIILIALGINGATITEAALTYISDRLINVNLSDIVVEWRHTALNALFELLGITNEKMEENMIFIMETLIELIDTEVFNASETEVSEEILSTNQESIIEIENEEISIPNYYIELDLEKISQNVKLVQGWFSKLFSCCK